VGRTKEQLRKAALVLYLVDLTSATYDEVQKELLSLEELNVPVIRVANKMDKGNPELVRQLMKQDFQFISAMNKTNLKALEDCIVTLFHVDRVKQGDVIVTNARHNQSLRDTLDALQRVLDGMDKGITGDFLAMDVRNALHHLGLITGQITTEDLLGNIFGKFCIGK
jgi:tRNA modification GTPase